MTDEKFKEAILEFLKGLERLLLAFKEEVLDAREGEGTPRPGQEE